MTVTPDELSVAVRALVRQLQHTEQRNDTSVTVCSICGLTPTVPTTIHYMDHTDHCPLRKILQALPYVEIVKAPIVQNGGTLDSKLLMAMNGALSELGAAKERAAVFEGALRAVETGWLRYEQMDGKRLPNPTCESCNEQSLNGLLLHAEWCPLVALNRYPHKS